MKEEPMSYEDMLQKINPVNRGIFRTILKVAEVPEVVLREYFAWKFLLDKVGSPIRAVDLLQMAIACGFNVHEQKFGVVTPIEIEVDQDTAEDVDPNGETAIDEVVEPEPAEDEGPENPTEDAMLEKGTVVQCLVEDEIQTGKVVNGEKDEYGEITYTVLVGEELHIVDDSDIKIPEAETDG